MRPIHLGICLVAMMSWSAVAGADDAEEHAVLARVLALVAPIVHVAATSPDPGAAQKEIDAIVAGRNQEANRMAAGLLEAMVSDFPPESRPALRSISRDLLVLARREQARTRALPTADATERAIQARKELHAMGLRYWDEQQYDDALRRGDAIAVELFLAARGLRNLPEGR
jgi:hypothetical protein